MAKEKNPLLVVLSTHRVSYVNIKEPSSFDDNGKAYYDCTFLIDKGHPDEDKIKAAIKAAYTANKESVFKGVPLTSPKLWNPLRDGDEYADEREAEGKSAEEYRGKMFIKAKSESQPKAFYSDKQDILDLDEVYSGCFCRGVIKCSTFNKNGNRGFSFWLNSLMKMDEGERMGGFEASADDYDDEDDLT